jgi:large subunit ribosomal protein L25
VRFLDLKFLHERAEKLPELQICRTIASPRAWRRTPPFASRQTDEDFSMASANELKATARPRAGKGAARAVRRQGRVPGVIYGDNQAPLAISLDHVDVRQRIYAGQFLTSIYDVDVDGVKHRVIPRDYQLDPVRDVPLHVDFLRLGAGARIRVRIPVHVKNADQAPGVKRGGTVNVVQHSIELRCPAEAIPAAIDVDLTGLEIGRSVHLSDLRLPQSVTVATKRDVTLVTIVAPSGYLEEQKAAAEAAAAAAAAAAIAAEAGEVAAPGAAPIPAPGAAPAAPTGAAAGAVAQPGEGAGEKK